MSKKKPAIPSQPSRETSGPVAVGTSAGSLSRTVWVCLLLVAATVAVYWPVAGFQFVNYDDQDYVSDNPHVLSGLTWRGVGWAFTTMHAANWHPLTWLSHMLDCQIFGAQAGGPHAVNLFFHALNAVLLFLALKKLTGAFWRSALVAALFALHPLHVESVAWVSERKDVLSTCFGFLTLIFYARHARKRAGVESRGAGGNGRQPGLDYWLALACFALGLMAKPMLVTWPFVLLLLDFWPLQRVSSFGFQVAGSPAAKAKPGVQGLRQLILEKMPFFVLSAVSCGVTFVAQHAGGAVQTLDRLPLPVRLENTVVSYVRYLGKAFWPADLANPYPHAGAWPAGWVWLAGLLLAGFSTGAVRLRRTRPYVFAGWFWFLGMLVPVIGLVQVGFQSMADRYTYVPLTGVFIIVAWAAGETAERLAGGKKILGGAGVLILLACAFRTAEQVCCWHDSGSLSRQAIAVTRDNDVAYSMLGNQLMEQGRTDEAITNYVRALECARGSGAVEVKVGAGEEFLKVDPTRIAVCAEVLNNLGIAWAKKGRAGEAVGYYRAALEINPNHAPALYNMAHDLADGKRYDEAIKYFEAAVKVRPDDVEIRDAFGNTLVKAGRPDEAIRQYQEVLKLAPADAKTHNYYGLVLADEGKLDEAAGHYETALRADPQLLEVHNNLGSVLVRQGKLDEAIRHFRELLKWMPEHPRAQDNLGVALASKGELDEAVEHLREAIRLQPDNAQTHFNLGNVLALKGSFDGAAGEFREAIRLAPGLVPAHCNLGGVLLQLGRRGEAEAQFREALRLKPDYAPAAEQLRNLGESVPQTDLQDERTDSNHLTALSAPLFPDGRLQLRL